MRIFLLSMLLASFLMLNGWGIEAPAVMFPEGFQKIVIPFSINDEDEMVIQGSVNGSPIQLILDTGMDASIVLNPDFCARASLFPRKPGNADQFYSASLHFFGRPDKVTARVLRSFTLILQGANFEMDRALELDDFSYFTRHSDRYAGVVGWGFFRNFHMVIDYPNHQITLENPDDNYPPLRGGIHLSGDSLPVIPVHVLGKDVSFLLDTGAPQTWLSYEFLAKKVPIPEFSSTPGNLKGIVKIDSLQVDQVVMPNLSICVVENFFAQSHSEDFQGILGLDALNAATVELDPARSIAEIRRK